MIIECPACTSRYRIREDKLPSDGGNIKCPNCAHIFFVPRADRRSASITGSVPATPSDPVPPLEPEEGVEEKKRWKLKNPVGLVYDFPDTEQIRQWLTSRESFDGIQVSSDGGSSWVPIAEEPALADVTPTGNKIGPQASLRNTGGRALAPQIPKSVDQLKAEAEARLAQARATRDIDSGSKSAQFKLIKAPATKEEARTSRLLLALSIVVLPALAAVGLHSSGVINLRDIELFEEPNPEGPVGVALPDRGYGPAEVPRVRDPVVDLTPEQVAAALINQAGAAQARGEGATAIQHLENAQGVLPADYEIACLLAPMYEAEQRTGDAGLAAERCAAGRAAEAEGSGDGAGDTPPAEGAPGGDAAAPAEGSAAETP